MIYGCASNIPSREWLHYVSVPGFHLCPQSPAGQGTSARSARQEPAQLYTREDSENPKGPNSGGAQLVQCRARSLGTAVPSGLWLRGALPKNQSGARGSGRPQTRLPAAPGERPPLIGLASVSAVMAVSGNQPTVFVRLNPFQKVFL